MKRSIKIALIVTAIVVVAGGIGFYFYWKNAKNSKVHYSSIELKRGDITYGVTATGNLNDSLVIDVGTQVSGIISKILTVQTRPVNPNFISTRWSHSPGVCLHR